MICQLNMVCATRSCNTEEYCSQIPQQQEPLVCPITEQTTQDILVQCFFLAFQSLRNGVLMHKMLGACIWTTLFLYGQTILQHRDSKYFTRFL